MAAVSGGTTRKRVLLAEAHTDLTAFIHKLEKQYNLTLWDTYELLTRQQATVIQNVKPEGK